MSSIFDNLGIDPGIIIIILLVLTIFLLVKSASSSMRLSRLERKYKTFMKDDKSLIILGGDGTIKREKLYR